MIILGAIFVLLGLIFMGFRRMLIRVYPGLSGVVISFLSFPHIFSYLLFFVFIELFTMLVDKIIYLLIRMKNPPSDESARQMRHHIKFTYLVGIELIGPFFFLVYEPFTGTTCFAVSCLDQIKFYVYARFFIVLGIAIVKTIIVFYSKSKATLKELLASKIEVNNFQSKIANMLQQACD